MPEPIIIKQYDPQWPERFAEISARVMAALGPTANRIEHVGSTSVPGLAAKPIIDIDVVVDSESQIGKVIELLAEIGYIHQGDLGITGREAFKTPANTFSHHLYLVVEETRELKRHVAFRDRLRSDAKTRQAYGELKSDLSKRFNNDREGYTKAKTEFIESVLRDSLNF